jgi:hypothetical protein
MSSSVHAAYLPGRAYGRAVNNGTGLDGVFFRAQNKAMNSKWVPANNWRFILHTAWLEFPGNAWIECGFMQGALQEPGASVEFWKGCYTAQGVGSSYYKEYKMSGFATGDDAYHTYQISRLSGPSNGLYTWGVYVDYKLQRSFQNAYQYGFSPRVGLETNESLATSSIWNEHSIQRIVNWQWKNWLRADTFIQQTNGASASFANSTTGNSINTWK